MRWRDDISSAANESVELLQLLLLLELMLPNAETELPVP